MCGLFCGAWPIRSNTALFRFIHAAAGDEISFCEAKSIPSCTWASLSVSTPPPHEHLITSPSGLQWTWEGISSTYSNLTSFEKVPGGVTAGSRESSLFSASHFHFKYFSAPSAISVFFSLAHSAKQLATMLFCIKFTSFFATWLLIIL